jgi:hypothetical protein
MHACKAIEPQSFNHIHVTIEHPTSSMCSSCKGRDGEIVVT